MRSPTSRGDEHAFQQLANHKHQPHQQQPAQPAKLQQRRQRGQVRPMAAPMGMNTSKPATTPMAKPDSSPQPQQPAAVHPAMISITASWPRKNWPEHIVDFIAEHAQSRYQRRGIKRPAAG